MQFTSPFFSYQKAEIDLANRKEILRLQKEALQVEQRKQELLKVSEQLEKQKNAQLKREDKAKKDKQELDLRLKELQELRAFKSSVEKSATESKPAAKHPTPSAAPVYRSHSQSFAAQPDLYHHSLDDQILVADKKRKLAEIKASEADFYLSKLETDREAKVLKVQTAEEVKTLQVQGNLDSAQIERKTEAIQNQIVERQHFVADRAHADQKEQRRYENQYALNQQEHNQRRELNRDSHTSAMISNNSMDLRYLSTVRITQQSQSRAISSSSSFGKANHAINTEMTSEECENELMLVNEELRRLKEA